MRLVLVSLRRVVVPILLALIGFAFAPAATAGLEKQAPAAPSYTYASFGHATHEVHAAAERGPPTAYDHTFTYDAAVERWTRGASSRADTATPPFAGTIYDDSATLEQVAGAAPTTERPTQGAWAPLSLPARSGVAANSVRPAVTDARLGRALADDFRGRPNPVGDGSALDAARHTVDTGDLVGGSTHLEKAVEMRDRYARILRRGGLSTGDQAAAQGRYDAYSSFVIENDLDAMMRARGLR